MLHLRLPYPLIYLFSYSEEGFIFENFEFSLLELRQHPIRDLIPSISTDPDLDPMELRGREVLYERLEAVLPTSTSLLTVSDFCEVHIQIIDEYEDICFWVELIEVHHLRNRLS